MCAIWADVSNAVVDSFADSENSLRSAESASAVRRLSASSAGAYDPSPILVDLDFAVPVLYARMADV